MKQIGTLTRPAYLLGFLLVGLLCASLTLVSVARADEPASGTDATAAGASDGSGATPTAEATEAKSEETTEEETPAPTLAEVTYAFDNLILFIAAVLVIFMQPGFAMVEVGLNSAKNAVNILFKNVMDLAVGVLLFFLVGYGLMYPGSSSIIPGFLGFAQVGISPDSPTPAAGTLNPQVDFLFQVAFAATAATIVSGAVAGRMRFGAYLVYSAVITGLVYPISGMWMWGGGWLKEMFDFHDFAGSVVVHAVGGFAGLAGAILLGPRIGRYVNGKSHPIPGHNLAFAALGVFILWVGWYGFNPGSQLAFAGQANTEATVKIAVNTTLAAAAGCVLAMVVAWALFKKPDLTMALNGALAGLVGITANCDIVSNVSAIIIGAVAGVLVVMGVVALDKLRIDDPVGAFPVHGLCGIWGGIACAIFGGSSFVGQLVGTATICAWAFVTMFGLFALLKAVGYLRVSAEDEQAGLDISEHGMHAYPPNLISDAFTGTPITYPAAAPAGIAPSAKPSAEGV